MDYLQDFLDFCKYQRGLADNTVDSYRWEVSQYLDWLKTRKLRLNQVKVRDIDAFLISLRKKGGNGIQTVNHKMYCLKSFYRWLQRVEVVKANPLEVFQNARTAKPLPRYLTQEEQEALLLVSDKFEYKTRREVWLRKRDNLMIVFFLDTGLRVSELCSIEHKNLDLDRGILRVIGKGSKEREIVLSNRVVEKTREYLSVAGEVGLNRTVGPGFAARGLTLEDVAKGLPFSYSTANRVIYSDHPSIDRIEEFKNYIDEKIKPLPIKFLFFNQQGHPMNSRHVFRIIREAGKRAGIKDLYPHALRHTFASNLRMKGGDLLLIKEALGHSSVQTTEIYAHIGNGQYREKLKSLIN
jgi:integrase/recombinase XerD